jgi:hypothetical protein
VTLAPVARRADHHRGVFVLRRTAITTQTSPIENALPCTTSCQPGPSVGPKRPPPRKRAQPRMKPGSAATIRSLAFMIVHFLRPALRSTVKPGRDKGRIVSLTGRSCEHTGVHQTPPIDYGDGLRCSCFKQSNTEAMKMHPTVPSRPSSRDPGRHPWE